MPLGFLRFLMSVLRTNTPGGTKFQSCPRKVDNLPKSKDSRKQDGSKVKDPASCVPIKPPLDLDTKISPK